MAKKSMIARDVKRKKNRVASPLKRAALMAAFEGPGPRERLELHGKSRPAPNSGANGVRNRCWATGKARGYYRDFGLCATSCGGWLTRVAARASPIQLVEPHSAGHQLS